MGDEEKTILTTPEKNDPRAKDATASQIKTFRLILFIIFYLVIIINLVSIESGNLWAIVSLAVSCIALVSIILRHRIAMHFVRIWSAGAMLYGAGAFLKALGQFLQDGIIPSAFIELTIALICIYLGSFFFANAPARLGISK